MAVSGASMRRLKIFGFSGLAVRSSSGQYKMSPFSTRLWYFRIHGFCFLKRSGSPSMLMRMVPLGASAGTARNSSLTLFHP